jgi:transcriptional regulator with XRE-family HTH domain
MNVSDNIRSIRKEKGLTQTEVARRYGTSPEFYHRLEKKDSTLTLEQLYKIAEALRVSVVEVLGFRQVIEDSNSEDLQTKVKELEKEVFDLKAENKMYHKHNKILFDNVEFLQNVVNSLMNNQQGLEKFKQIVTGGNAAVEEQIKQAATSLFPDLAKQIELRKNKPDNS